ncbi:MAG: phosphate butyryltransferase [candidate division WOR-3 bacterium]|nr:MAG: phosphate butyryltransferase [candidate division WOR-3 bacterium]
MRSFKDIITLAKKKNKKRCIVVMAEDSTVLEGVKLAENIGIVIPVLVGNKTEIVQCAERINFDLARAEIHDARDAAATMELAVKIVRDQGDFLMKGMISSSQFLKGILDKKYGLRTGNILSHVAVLEVPAYHKLIFMSDGGMNPRLDLASRVGIIKNATIILRKIGLSNPKIAIIAASETIHPDMPETTDAVKIVEMNKNREIPDCIIEGPFGFDVAVSREAAVHKNITSKIAGDVDFLLMPSISAANIWAKGLILFAGAQAAGTIAGAARPVVMLSRADTPATKLNSIALGVILSEGTHVPD